MADEGEIKLLQQEVLAQLLEDAYAGQFVPETPEQFHACVEYFCPGGRESVLEQHILNLSRYAGSFPGLRNGWRSVKMTMPQEIWKHWFAAITDNI